MSKIGKISVFLLMVVLLVALPLSGCGKAEPAGPQEGVIKIGLLTDLTGPIAASSVPGLEAMEDWTKYVNEELGGIRGHQIELIVVDAKYDNDLAASGFEKLVNQDKVHYISCACANYQPVVKPLASRYHMPCSGPTEYAVLLPHTPDSFMFGYMPHYADMYRCSLTWIKDNWKGDEPPRIGIMGLDASFSKSTIKPIKWMLENELNWPIVAEEWMTMSAMDVTSQVTNLKNANCDYVLMPLTGAPQLIFQKTAYAAGLTDSTQLVDIFITMMMSFRQLDPEATTGLMSHSPCALLQMADEVEVIGLINQLHETNRPDAPPLDWIRIINYAGSMLVNDILGKTIDKYGYDGLTGDNIKWIMEHKMKGYTAEGLIGSLPWSTEQHGGPRANIIVKTTPDFGLEILKLWQEMPPWPEEAQDPSFWKL
ncbi:MAG: ABC transporter substrate-binding protein [Dehalococcoidia bacterium]|nr:MAG: ABC transporter substrate-binding protein [Dehalococcoidia bacterium]